MPRSSPCRLVVLALLLAQAVTLSARGQGPSFEAVLGEKGLKRFGASYILKDTEEREDRLREFQAALEQLNTEFRFLLEDQLRLKADVKKAKDEVDSPKGGSSEKEEEKNRREKEAKEALNRAEIALVTFEARHRAEFQRHGTRQLELQGEIRALVDQTARIYAKLADDPAVKQAIRTHNRDRRPKVVLGPVASREEYLAAIRKEDIEVLREKGVVVDPQRRQLVLAAEDRVGSLAYQAEKLLAKLEALEKRSANALSKRDDLLKRRKDAAAELARAQPGRQQPIIAKLNLIDDQLKRLDSGGAEAEAEMQRRAEELATAREEFDLAFRQLREAADKVSGIRQVIEDDPEVRAAVEELQGKKGSTKIPAPPNYHRGLATLERLEKLTRTTRAPIAVGPDGEGPAGGAPK